MDVNKEIWKQEIVHIGIHSAIKTAIVHFVITAIFALIILIPSDYSPIDLIVPVFIISKSIFLTSLVLHTILFYYTNTRPTMSVYQEGIGIFNHGKEGAIRLYHWDEIKSIDLFYYFGIRVDFPNHRYTNFIHTKEGKTIKIRFDIQDYEFFLTALGKVYTKDFIYTKVHKNKMLFSGQIEHIIVK